MGKIYYISSIYSGINNISNKAIINLIKTYCYLIKHLVEINNQLLLTGCFSGKLKLPKLNRNIKI